jgi:hypothetical protein
VVTLVLLRPQAATQARKSPRDRFRNFEPILALKKEVLEPGGRRNVTKVTKPRPAALHRAAPSIDNAAAPCSNNNFTIVHRELSIAVHVTDARWRLASPIIAF